MTFSFSQRFSISRFVSTSPTALIATVIEHLLFSSSPPCYVCGLNAKEGPPSRRELCRRLGISVGIGKGVRRKSKHWRRHASLRGIIGLLSRLRMGTPLVRGSKRETFPKCFRKSAKYSGTQMRNYSISRSSTLNFNFCSRITDLHRSCTVSLSS